MMQQFLADMSAVVSTRLETAEGGAKGALEAALRIACRMEQDAKPIHFVRRLDRMARSCPLDCPLDMVVELSGISSLAREEIDETAGIDGACNRDRLDDDLLAAVAALRSGDAAPLTAWLDKWMFIEAADDRALLAAYGVTDLDLLREECSACVPEMVEEVRLSLHWSTDRMAAVEVADEWVFAGAEISAEAAGTREARWAVMAA